MKIFGLRPEILQNRFLLKDFIQDSSGFLCEANHKKTKLS